MDAMGPESDLLRLAVLTPDKSLLDVAGVAWVQVPLADGGGIGIKPRHAPLLAATVTGPVRYADAEGSQHTLDVEAGILQVTTGLVTIFTSGLAGAEAIDLLPDESQARFDRLAHALLTTLGAGPVGRWRPDSDD
jgi:F0F1-type ATP synthase epsilon subunit